MLEPCSGNMAHIFDTNSLEGKILLLAVEVYPLTIKDISNYLNSPIKRVERSIQTLAKKGLIALEPGPDITYVTLASGDFSFKGKETEQLKRVREKMKKRAEWHLPDDDNNVMYG